MLGVDLIPSSSRTRSHPKKWGSSLSSLQTAHGPSRQSLVALGHVGSARVFTELLLHLAPCGLHRGASRLWQSRPLTQALLDGLVPVAGAAMSARLGTVATVNGRIGTQMATSD